MTTFKKFICHFCDRRFFTARGRKKHEFGFHRRFGIPKKVFVRNP